MEAWAKYIFHFPNAPANDNMTGNLSWMSDGQRAYLQYLWGNFTENGKSFFSYKENFDMLFYMVNNASENLDGRFFARYIAGHDYIQGDHVTYLVNKLPGYGLVDPKELIGLKNIVDFNKTFEDYGNLTLALAELNETHQTPFSPQLQNFLNSTLKIIQNLTWMERRFMEVYYFPTNKSFQWQGDWNLGYIAKPVNDTADLYWLLWNNQTVRNVLGYDFNANKTIFWFAGVFGQYLDKGAWNGLWPDERVFKLAVQYIEEMGNRIKNSISIKNSMIALRDVPLIYGASGLDNGNQGPFKEDFIENTTMQGDTPYTFKLNGVTYKISDPITYFNKNFPDSINHIKSLIEGKNVIDAWGALADDIRSKIDNGTDPGGYPENVTNLVNLTMRYMLNADSNPDNDVPKIGFSCGIGSDMTNFIFHFK